MGLCYIMYESDMLEKPIWTLYDEEDGAIGDISKENLYKAIQDDPSQASLLANTIYDEEGLKVKPIGDTLELTNPKYACKLRPENDELVIERSGLQGRIPWSATKTIVGFFIDVAEQVINFFVYDKANGNGQKVTIPLQTA